VKLAHALLLAACTVAGGAQAAQPARTEYRLDHERAQAAYKLESDSCKKLQGNPRQVCRIEARSNFNIAKAEIDARHKHSPANQDNVKLSKAEGAYEVALAKCGSFTGNAKDVCKADAKANLVVARSEAKLSRASVDKGMYSHRAVSERREAREDTADALFTAAKERCDALSSQAKANCVGDAKRRYGKL
jgi:hypothetical protein